jgi:hypothetical protein
MSSNGKEIDKQFCSKASLGDYFTLERFKQGFSVLGFRLSLLPRAVVTCSQRTSTWVSAADRLKRS